MKIYWSDINQCNSDPTVPGTCADQSWGCHCQSSWPEYPPINLKSFMVYQLKELVLGALFTVPCQE